MKPISVKFGLILHISHSKQIFTFARLVPQVCESATVQSFDIPRFSFSTKTSISEASNGADVGSVGSFSQDCIIKRESN